MDNSSKPKRSPTAIGDDVVDAIMELRKREKWGAARIAAYLEEKGIEVSASTVHRTLKRHQISRVRDMDPPTGEPMRVIRYEHERPGDMIHVDIKKVGRIPKGGGWAVHGQGTDEARASKRKAARTGKVGYAYLHSAVEELTNTRHKRTRPYTPRTNGKVERYNQTMVAEWLRRRPYDSDDDRTKALADFLNYYNFERRHSALGWLPPITRVPLVGGPKVEPQELGDQLLDATPDQLSIFDEL